MLLIDAPLVNIFFFFKNMNIINIIEQYIEEGGLQYYCGSAAV